MAETLLQYPREMQSEHRVNCLRTAPGKTLQKKKKIKDMQRLESLLKHFLLPLPIPKCKHDIHSTQWETFIQSIHTKK